MSSLEEDLYAMKVTKAYAQISTCITRVLRGEKSNLKKSEEHV